MTATLNIPNQITLARLVLAAVFFGVLSLFSAEHYPANRWVMQVAFVVFVAAALSDALDGYLARRWRQITLLGRVLDPFADKILICGAFVFFASRMFPAEGALAPIATVAPWMAIVILARELLISALRAAAEAAGVDFSADWWGKAKMILQSITIAVLLAVAAFGALAALQPVAVALVWATVIVTALSAISYVRRAWPVLIGEAAT